MSKKPWRDPSLGGKKPPPQHVWPYCWYGSSDVACERCHHKLSEVERRNLECITDEQMQQAAIAGRVFQKRNGK